MLTYYTPSALTILETYKDCGKMKPEWMRPCFSLMFLVPQFGKKNEGPQVLTDMTVDEIVLVYIPFSFFFPFSTWTFPKWVKYYVHTFFRLRN